MKKAHEQVTTVAPESPGIPAREWFTTYSVLSPAIGLFVTVACERLRKLHASVEALRPHGFAVRPATHSSHAWQSVHRIPRQRS
jgi:hypothetical protein